MVGDQVSETYVSSASSIQSIQRAAHRPAGRARRPCFKGDAIVASIQIKEKHAIGIDFRRARTRLAAVFKGPLAAASVPGVAHAVAVRERRLQHDAAPALERFVLGHGRTAEDGVAEPLHDDGRPISAVRLQFAIETADAVVEDAVTLERLIEQPRQILAADPRRDAREVVERRLKTRRGAHELHQDGIEHRTSRPALERAKRQQRLRVEHACGRRTRIGPVVADRIAFVFWTKLHAQIARNEAAEVPAFCTRSIYREVALVDDLRHRAARRVFRQAIDERGRKRARVDHALPVAAAHGPGDGILGRHRGQRGPPRRPLCRHRQRRVRKRRYRYPLAKNPEGRERGIAIALRVAGVFALNGDRHVDARQSLQLERATHVGRHGAARADAKRERTSQHQPH